jgi:hypothetical protein
MIGLLPKLGLAMTQIQQALQDQYAKKAFVLVAGRVMLMAYSLKAL